MNQHEPIQLALIKQASLFRPLDEHAIRQLAAQLKWRRYRAGDIIFHQGDPGVCLYLIVAGHVRISLVNPDGREVTLCMYGPGDIFGELSALDEQPRSATATAQRHVSALMLHREDFVKLLRSNAVVAEHIIGLLTERLRYTADYSRQLAFLDVSGRVANQLLQLATIAGVSEPVQLTLTQQELAEFANTTREWVNRIINSFAAQGLIRLARGKIIVLNLAGLQRLI